MAIKRKKAEISDEEWERYEVSFPYFVEKWSYVFFNKQGNQSEIIEPYQKLFMEHISTNRKAITRIASRMGTTNMLVCYGLWKALFFEDEDIYIHANSLSEVREIRGKIRRRIKFLPKEMQYRVATWRNYSVTFRTGSRLYYGWGGGCFDKHMTCFIGDNWAFTPEEHALKIKDRAFEYLNSRKDYQTVVTSTPNGLNHFKELLDAAGDHRFGWKRMLLSRNMTPSWTNQTKTLLAAAKSEEERNYLRSQLLCEFVELSNDYENTETR